MNGSSKPVNATRHKRGRKPTSESRAAEIRARLMEWKHTPESFRSSLRTLAAEMGTSHWLSYSILSSACHPYRVICL